MWTYEKRLQFPVKITQTCPKTASLIISQFGGPDGELAASMRYLSQRYTMPCKEVGGLLTDIGTEELAHLEMICAIIYQLTKNLTPEQAKTAGFDAYYIDHTTALWPTACLLYTSGRLHTASPLPSSSSSRRFNTMSNLGLSTSARAAIWARMFSGVLKYCTCLSWFSLSCPMVCEDIWPLNSFMLSGPEAIREIPAPGNVILEVEKK